MRPFYRFGKKRKRCKYRGFRVFPACLVSTIFVAQNAVCNGFGYGLRGRAGEHHEHQLGVCGPMGGLRWAVFMAVQHERPRVAEIKHQSCRYCCRTWFWGRFEAVPMAPKHEKGNTTGDHDAADARVRRARARGWLKGRGEGARIGEATAMPARAARPYNLACDSCRPRGKIHGLSLNTKLQPP